LFVTVVRPPFRFSVDLQYAISFTSLLGSTAWSCFPFCFFFCPPVALPTLPFLSPVLIKRSGYLFLPFYELASGGLIPVARSILRDIVPLETFFFPRPLIDRCFGVDLLFNFASHPLGSIFLRMENLLVASYRNVGSRTPVSTWLRPARQNYRCPHPYSFCTFLPKSQLYRDYPSSHLGLFAIFSPVPPFPGSVPLRRGGYVFFFFFSLRGSDLVQSFRLYFEKTMRFFPQILAFRSGSETWKCMPSILLGMNGSFF